MSKNHCVKVAIKIKVLPVEGRSHSCFLSKFFKERAIQFLYFGAPTTHIFNIGNLITE